MKKNNKKGKREYRLFYLLILLLLTTITLSVTTYAWFTASKLVRVDLLDVNVKSDGNVEISSDGHVWKPELKMEDIIQARNTYPTSVNQIPEMVEPVSTGGNITNGNLVMFYGLVTSNPQGDFILETKKLQDEESNGKNSKAKYLAFDIFLRTNKETMLSLTPESQILYKGEGLNGIENSVRVAFINEGNIPSEGNISTIQNSKTSDVNKVYIWEPNYNTHTEFGIKNAKEIYGINNIGSNRLNYDGVIAEIASDKNILINKANKGNNPSYFAPVAIDIETTQNFTENVPVFKISNGITKLRIYMWIEGQDVDCEDNAAIGGVGLNIKFTSDNKTE